MSRKDKRFVIQEHTAGIRHRRIHWDFMLESGNILQTYRLDKAPDEILHYSANALRILDHSLKFLTYQGPVNKGQGSVCIVESGTFQIIRQNHSRVKLNLNGQTLEGKFILVQIKDDEWLFHKQ